MSHAGRAPQFLLISSLLLLSWLGMMAVHESGHCIAAWLTGGRVARVVLHPLAISRTDLAYNPHPLVVAWGGAVMGTVIPLLLYASAASAKAPSAYLFRFFAGFCLVINGFYLAEDAFLKAADSADIIRHGSPAWAPVLFGAASAALGLRLWNGLGTSFGLGGKAEAVDRRHAWGTFCALLAVVFAELLLSR